VTTAEAADALARALHYAKAEDAMLLTLAVVCLVLWALGLLTTAAVGSALHILLVIAVVLFLVHIIQGRSIGNA
jgi:hypothetical protein